MFNCIDQPLAVVRRHGRSFTIIEANLAFTRLSGYDKHKLTQTPFRQIFPRLADSKNAVLPDGITETTLETGSGIQKPVEIDVKSLDVPDADGQPTFLIIAKDMSAEKWLEQQSRSGKALYTGICDNQLRIRMFNTHAQQSMSNISIVHQSIFEFLDPTQNETLREQLLSCSLTDHPCDIVAQTIRIDEHNEFELRATIYIIYDGFGALQQYAFSVWDMRESEEADQPGMKLKIWMAKRDISASQLSASTGISMQTISKLRNGKIMKPQRLTAELVASELNVDVNTLWPELGRR